MSITRIVFHGNCIDGLGSYFLYRQSLGNDAIVESYPVSPSDVRTWPADPTPDMDVVLLDVCGARPVMERWATQAKSLLVLDHHETSAECLASLGTCAHYASDHCATYQTFRHLYPDAPIPDWVHMVERIDLWKGVTPFDRSMRELLHPIANLPVQKQCEEAMAQFRVFVEAYSTASPAMLDLIAEGARRLAKKHFELDALLTASRHTIALIDQTLMERWGLDAGWLGRRVFIADTTRYSGFDTTEAAQRVFEQIPGVQCFINYHLSSWLDKSTRQQCHKYTYHARSIEGVDLTVGGFLDGHRCAAGTSRQYHGVPLPFLLI
jgi:hypothetical protein